MGRFDGIAGLDEMVIGLIYKDLVSNIMQKLPEGFKIGTRTADVDTKCEFVVVGNTEASHYFDMGDKVVSNAGENSSCAVFRRLKPPEKGQVLDWRDVAYSKPFSVSPADCGRKFVLLGDHLSFDRSTPHFGGARSALFAKGSVVTLAGTSYGGRAFFVREGEEQGWQIDLHKLAYARSDVYQSQTVKPDTGKKTMDISKLKGFEAGKTAEQLGLKFGDNFFMLEDSGSVKKGTVVTLFRADGSDCPKFSYPVLGGGRTEGYIQLRYLAKAEAVAEEMKPGDRFTLEFTVASDDNEDGVVTATCGEDSDEYEFDADELQYARVTHLAGRGARQVTLAEFKAQFGEGAVLKME